MVDALLFLQREREGAAARGMEGCFRLIEIVPGWGRNVCEPHRPHQGGESALPQESEENEACNPPVVQCRSMPLDKSAIKSLGFGFSAKVPEGRRRTTFVLRA